MGMDIDNAASCHALYLVSGVKEDSTVNLQASLYTRNAYVAGCAPSLMAATVVGAGLLGKKCRVSLTLEEMSVTRINASRSAAPVPKSGGAR